MNDYDQALLDSLRYDGPVSSPYTPVTQGPGSLTERRVTAYFYAAQHGLPVTFGFLLELGGRAARLARWYGEAELRVQEDPHGIIGPVHTWPEWVFEESAASIVRDLEAQVQRDEEAGHGYGEAGYYG